MTATTAYISGLKQSMKSWKIWALLYFLNLTFALIIILPISKYLEDTVGRSLLTESLVEGFNYTFMHDFLANYEVSISAMTELSIVILLLYLIFSVFTAGGIVNTFHKNNKATRLRDFWSGCTYFFWRMWRITFYFLLIQLAVLAVFGLIFWTYTNGMSPDKLESEMPIVNALKVLTPIYLFFAVLVSMLQNYVKIKAVQLDKIWLRSAFKVGIRFVRKNFKKVFSIYFLNLLTLSLIYFLYRFGSGFNGLSLGLIFGQIWIIARIGLGLWNVGSGLSLIKTQIEGVGEK